MKSRTIFLIIGIAALLTLPTKFVAKQARNLLEANGATATRRSSRSISNPLEPTASPPAPPTRPMTLRRMRADPISTTLNGKS